MKTIPLSKPINKGDQEITSITLDFNSLKGSDLIKAEQECRLDGNVSLQPFYTSHGQAYVAAKASGLVPEDIMDLAAPDFIQVTTEVSNFLYGWISPVNNQ